MSRLTSAELRKTAQTHVTSVATTTLAFDPTADVYKVTTTGTKGIASYRIPTLKEAQKEFTRQTERFHG